VELRSDLLVQVWDALLDMADENLVQRFCQVRNSKILAVRRVSGVARKELLLFLDGVADCNFVVDLFLGATLHSVVA